MLWQKNVRVADWVTRFTVGEDYRWDTILLPYDLTATEAHAWGLAHIGVLTPEELAAVQEGLAALRAAYDAGEVAVRPEDEDCHTVIETRLTERLGEVGKKIHTGRSRNDQVLAALRLFLREALAEVGGGVLDLGEALVALGTAHADALLPGYTHLQRAMPSSAGLWAMGFAELFADDLVVLEAAREAADVSPLGSAAGYGVPYLDLPRDAVAARLGFRGVQRHVTAVQLSRGKLEAQVVHALVQAAATANRLASDLVLFNTAEFGFVTLPAAYCTGSSIMPQKQNPDVLELARATYHRLTAELSLLLGLPAGLPSGYHRDLQLTKEATMRAVLTAADLFTALNHLVPGIGFRRERMQAAATPELFATADALEQVQAGHAFRDAYRLAAARAGTRPAPSSAEALAAYPTPGGPGRLDAEAVRSRLEAHRAWTAHA